MPTNFPCIRLSCWTKPNHSVRDRRLDSYKIRLASVFAAEGALAGKVFKLISFTFQPYLSYFSSLSNSLFLRLPLVLSIGFQPASHNKSIVCLRLLGLNFTQWP